MGAFLGFLMWLPGGAAFMFLGIYAMCAKEPVRFWNIGELVQVTDVKKYNRAMAKLWFVSAVVWVILGIPLLMGQNSAWVTVPVLGGMCWAVALMVAYTRIEKKYRIL